MTRYSKWLMNSRRHGIYARDAYTCQYCGTVMQPGDARLSLDHLIPWATMLATGNGKLDHSNTNLVTCCGACNSSRGDRPLADFAPGGALARIAVQIATPVDVEAGAAAYAALRQSKAEQAA